MNYLRPASRTSIYLATMQLVIDRHFVSVLLEGRSFLPEGPSHIQDVVLPAGQRLCTKVLPEALLAGQAAVRSIIKHQTPCIQESYVSVCNSVSTTFRNYYNNNSPKENNRNNS
jgi:hypothetical protein